jgi:hypothetical protein
MTADLNVLAKEEISKRECSNKSILPIAEYIEGDF